MSRVALGVHQSRLYQGTGFYSLFKDKKQKSENEELALTSSHKSGPLQEIYTFRKTVNKRKNKH